MPAKARAARSCREVIMLWALVNGYYIAELMDNTSLLMFCGRAHNTAMPYSVEGKLVVAISSRALFDFEEENRIFDAEGEAAYIALQYGRLDVPARHGVAFPLVKKLLAFNTPGQGRVEVAVLSKNDPVSGLR